MSYTLTELKSEIENDPDAIGYKNGSWKPDQVIADLINGVTGPSYTVNRISVPAESIRSQTTFDAYDGLTASETEWFSWLTQSGDVAVTTENLADLAGVGGTSRWATGERAMMDARMQALMQFQGSRAEDLWGEGVSVSAGDVGRAFNV